MSQTIVLTVPADCLPCCSLCPPSPTAMTMVNSGITFCLNECLYPFDRPLELTADSFSASQSFTYAHDQIEGLDGTFDFNEYSNEDPTCGGSVIQTTTTNPGIIVECSGGPWTVLIQMNSSSNDYPVFFYATGTGALPKGIPIDNQITSCLQTGAWNGPAGGYGGTITLDW